MAQLLKELADAKTLAAQFQESLDRGIDITGDIGQAEKRVEALEKRAKEAMKKLGCVSPVTRLLYYGMADMLISWNTLKDGME